MTEEKRRERELSKYLRQVKKYLPCTARMKRRLIAEIREGATAFMRENLFVDHKTLAELFGAPEDVAASYVESTGTAEILRSLRVRRRIVAIVSIVAAVILISWASVVTWAAIKEREVLNSHIEVYITNDQDEQSVP